MKNFLQKIRYYWFGIFISAIIFISVSFFLIILLSPKQDAQKRGFIPCTEQLAQNLYACAQDKKYSCLVKEILKNSWCDVKVIGQGFSNWLAGRQPAPWSNYFFTPEPVPATWFDGKMGEHPELAIEHLQKLSEELDRKNQELQNRKEDEKDEEKR